jgi:hypothetical protein
VNWSFSHGLSKFFKSRLICKIIILSSLFLTVFVDATLLEKKNLLLSETLLGFPNGTETLKEFPIVTNFFF